MAAIIIVTLLCSVPGQAVPDSVRPEVREAWLAQAGAASLCGALAITGLVIVGAATLSHIPGSEDLGYLTAVLVAVPVVPAACAGGAHSIGRRNGQDGRFWPAYLGGLAGLAGGVLVGGGVSILAGHSEWGVVLASVSELVGPGIGATVGYNLSRSPASKAHAWLERLEPPATFATTVLDENGCARAAIDCRLVTVRF